MRQWHGTVLSRLVCLPDVRTDVKEKFIENSPSLPFKTLVTRECFMHLQGVVPFLVCRVAIKLVCQRPLRSGCSWCNGRKGNLSRRCPVVHVLNPGGERLYRVREEVIKLIRSSRSSVGTRPHFSSSRIALRSQKVL